MKTQFIIKVTHSEKNVNILAVKKAAEKILKETERKNGKIKQ